MKRAGCLFVIVAVLLLAAVGTCPAKKGHVEKVSSVVSNVIDDETKGLGKFAISLVDELTGINHVERAVDRLLDVENYYIFSLGRIHWQGKDHVASLGLFGMVFTAPEEMLKRKIKDLVGE
ncbi:MAG: hypothetical protein IKU76_04845 [Bacteroidaceae bacterium]|nr:hypothetical protein [Bacteroidaceae bacterium]